MFAIGTGFQSSFYGHPCSDGFDEEIEWLFQLKENEGIEKVFQWFKVQCKMRKFHETCKVMVR